MLVKPYDEVPLEDVYMDGVADTGVRWLIAQKDGAPNFAMRLFEVQPGGHTPFHAHKGEHEIFIVEGAGQLNTEKGPVPLTPGVFAFVPEGEKHQFENTGDTVLKFLCIIPNRG